MKRVMTIPTIVLFMSCSALVASASLAQTSQPALTPAATALLIEPKSAADVSRLREALSDPDPYVRTVAARVAAVLGRKDLAATVRGLAAAEKDPLAAAEQIRTVLVLSGAAAVEEMTVVALRIGSPARFTVAEWLARNASAQLVSALGDLAKGATDAESARISAIVVMAIDESPSLRPELTRAWLNAATRVGWRAFLTRLVELRADLPFADALASPSPAIREATIFAALSLLRMDRQFSTADLQSALELQPPPGAPDSDWGQFGRNLLLRRLARATPIDGAEAIRRHANEHRGDARGMASMSEVTAAERSALRAALGAFYPKQNAESTFDDSADYGLQLVSARMIVPVVPGLVGGVMKALGCHPRAVDMAAATSMFRPDGRISDLRLFAPGVPPPCESAVKTLALLTVAEDDRPLPKKDPQWLVLVMDKMSVECVDASPPDAMDLPSTSSSQPPKLTKQASAVYPASMSRERIQGVVALRLAVSSSGCVRSVRVIRGVLPPLNLSALRAVASWRFDPALAMKKPVTTWVLVTVNFKLD